MVFKRLEEDLDAFLARDPAARSRIQIALCYPGFHALLFFRASQRLWRWRLTLAARFVSHLGRLFTGIEIHPGARIGRRLVIDHGFGVVIGETAEIGDDVTLYHGVTLGGILPSVNSHLQKNVKRHPTLEDGVIVGSGAQILGPIVVGAHARVGSNSVVTRDVPPGVSAIGVPAHVIAATDRTQMERFSAYATTEGDCPDPLQASIDALTAQLSTLVTRVDALQAELQARVPRPVDGSDQVPAPLDGATPAEATIAPVTGDQARH